MDDIVVGAPYTRCHAVPVAANTGAIFVISMEANGLEIKAAQRICNSEGGLGVVISVEDRFGDAVSRIGGEFSEE